MSDTYRSFLEAKVAAAPSLGLPCDPGEVQTHRLDGHPLRDHQRAIVRWGVEGGRRAYFLNFGLGKSTIQAETGLPRSYEWGFPNANCLESGCAKAQSPNYWALHRKMKPEGFARTAAICRDKGVRLAIVGQEIVDGKRKNIRAFIDDIPVDQPTTNAIAPVCDFLCHLAEQDLAV